MSEINSPLGRQRLSSVPSRVLTVSDEEEEAPVGRVSKQEVEELTQIKKAAQDNRKRVSLAARERIEYLTGLGKASGVFEIEDESGSMVKFKLTSIDGKSTKMAFKHGSKCDSNAEAMFDIRHYTLAFAIQEIDGMSIEEIIGEDSLENRVQFVSELDEEVLDFLEKSYKGMIAAKKKKFKIETLEEVKEVVEDLKK